MKFYVCEEPCSAFKCPLILQERDENKLESSLQEKNICIKCLVKHKDECYPSRMQYACATQ